MQIGNTLFVKLTTESNDGTLILFIFNKRDNKKLFCPHIAQNRLVSSSIITHTHLQESIRHPVNWKVIFIITVPVFAKTPRTNDTTNKIRWIDDSNDNSKEIFALHVKKIFDQQKIANILQCLSEKFYLMRQWASISIQKI